MRIDRIKLITELAKRDMTQAKLAELSGVSRATINYVKSGKSCTDNNMNQYAKKANATCYSSSMRLQKQFISAFMCVASFDKNCSEGLGKFPNKRHLYYRCTACQFAF